MHVQTEEINIGQGTGNTAKTIRVNLNHNDYDQCDAIHLEVIKGGDSPDLTIALVDSRGEILDPVGPKFLQAGVGVAPDDKWCTSVPFEVRDGMSLRINLNIGDPLSEDLKMYLYFRLNRDQ